MRNRIANLLPWLMLTLLTIAIFIAAQTENTHFDCAYDDQVMESDGTCRDIDFYLDSYQDQR